MATKPQFDRAAEDLGNIVELGHVNVTVPDQTKATAFYLMGLGLTRDPYLMAGLENMWVNVGRGQFHLPTREPQVVRGTTALVDARPQGAVEAAGLREEVPGRHAVQLPRNNDAVETTCPWGNRIRVHEPDPKRFGAMRVGMPYVEFDVPAGTDLKAIARFYTEILDGIAGVAKDDRGPYAWASCSAESKVVYRPIAKKKLPDYDGHHIQITLADFSGPHKKLLERGLITEESDQHQYRFLDIVDVDTNKPLFRIGTRRAACGTRCSTGCSSIGTPR